MQQTDVLQAWTRRTFCIKTKLGALMEVDGILFTGAPIGLHIRDRYVEITHVPSGFRIATADSLGAAMGIVLGIAPMTDWTQESPKISNAIGETIAILSGTTFAPRMK
jgi:hypothetical protein